MEKVECRADKTAHCYINLPTANAPSSCVFYFLVIKFLSERDDRIMTEFPVAIVKHDKRI